MLQIGPGDRIGIFWEDDQLIPYSVKPCIALHEVYFNSDAYMYINSEDNYDDFKKLKPGREYAFNQANLTGDPCRKYSVSVIVSGKCFVIYSLQYFVW